MRRVVVKARIVRLKVTSRAADAHVRYLQRDGTTRDGERGRLYGADTDAADGKAFTERGREDRHQFRFIVAPEDGDRLSDLRSFTRDVMRQMEEDLGTRLDWVAVDHFNTGHPHSHVIVRGRDEQGKDLIIAQDYITDGVRLRAQERATLERSDDAVTDLLLPYFGGICYRYGFVNLNDDAIVGGRYGEHTLGLNWYWNPNIKFQLNYINGQRTVPAGAFGGNVQGIALRGALEF